MRLDQYIRDYRAYRDELFTIIDSSDTRFFLDTSVLTWPIRLGSRARAEFFAWVGSRPSGSVMVPVWAAHELHTLIVKKELITNVRSLVTETERKYSEFARAAAERADDLPCSAEGFTGRDDFLEHIQRTLASLTRFGRIVKEQDSLSGAADEVVRFVNGHMLETDLQPIIADIEATGELRYSHLMPPGFHDRKKETNRYGDLIIWREIIGAMPERAATEAQRPAAVLISRDAKTDWISTAPLIVDETERTSAPQSDTGFDVVLPHPLLAHEFSTRTGGCSIYVTQPGVLATALQVSAAPPPLGVSTWLSAAFRPDHVNQVERLLQRFPPAPGATPASSTADTAPGNPPTTAPADQLFNAPSLADLLAPAVRRIVRDAAAGGVEEQAAFVAGWLEDTVNGRLTPIELGTRLAFFYSAPERIADLAAVLEIARAKLSLEARRLAVLAIAAHACFATAGDVRRPPHTGLLNVMLTFAADPAFHPVFVTLEEMTRHAGAEYLYLPGQKTRPSFQIELSEKSGKLPQRIRSMLIGGQNVMVEVLPTSPRSLTNKLGAEQCEGRQLRHMLAREYAIDPAALNTAWDQLKMKWDSDAGLASLDPEAPGGVSPMDDGDEL